MMKMPMPDPAKVEVLKVWYSVFCTLVDAYKNHEYTDAQFIEKMGLLREGLRKEVPQVEAELAAELARAKM